MPFRHSAIPTSVNIIEGETTLSPPATVKRSRSKPPSTRTRPNLLEKQEQVCSWWPTLAIKLPRYPAMHNLVPHKTLKSKHFFPSRNCKTNIWLLTHGTSWDRLNKSLDPVSSSREVPKVWNSNCANCTLYKFHSFSAQVSETLSYHNVLTFGSETIAQASLYAKRDGDWHRVPFRISQFHSKPDFQESMKASQAQNSLYAGRRPVPSNPAECLQRTCGGHVLWENNSSRIIHAGALLQEHKTWSKLYICKAFEGCEC